MRCYFLSIKLAAAFHPKAKDWVTGRAGIFRRLALAFSEKRKKYKPLVWMHCASLGEFEQGRPLLEKIRSERPGVQILLTFFSPSGYHIRKNYPGADFVFYLPSDSATHARHFLDLTRPDAAIFVKYEFWYHYLHELKRQNIPCLLIAASFRAGQPFFRWYGSVHRQMLACFTHIFVQNEDSLHLLQTLPALTGSVVGDPRVDRVLQIAKQVQPLPEVEQWCGHHPVLVCGSTWPADEKILFDLMTRRGLEHWKFILAPHDVQASHLLWLEKKLPLPFVRFSALKGSDAASRLLLVDNIGQLAGLYRFGHGAYIGGGFGSGIHNLLEPAAFGLPVLFGPRHEKFVEAAGLLAAGAGFVVRNGEDCHRILTQNHLMQAAGKSKQWLEAHSGATEKIFERLVKWL